MKIAIVDDSKLTKEVIKNLLTDIGYRDILLFSSAEELFEYLGIDKNEPSNEHHPDLILLDIFMKGMNGIEACRILNSKGNFKDIPIIMITASGNDGDLLEAFGVGARDYITKPYRKIELIARIQAALQLRKEIELRQTQAIEMIKLASELQNANDLLKNLSFLDSLTGIPNRRYFEEIVSREWEKSLKNQQPVSVFMIDVDFFKKYNDTYGHLYGDKALKEVALALKNSLRQPQDIVARYGGEEFIAFLPGCSLENASSVGKKMVENVRRLEIPHSASTAADHVTVSIGIISLVPDKKISFEKAISTADSVLYRVKESGRNNFKGLKCRLKEKA